MSDPSCPFCRPQSDRVFYVSDLVLGLWDAFPVSPGHALLVPKRHVADWFSATHEERRALTDATEAARQAVVAVHAPQGFNIGINIGTASGQTVPHLHVHVIPRYTGDVADPRGGVRHVVPKLANYLVTSPEPSSSGRLVTGGDDPLLPHIVAHLATANAVDVVVSFVLRSGVERVFEHLRDLLARGARLRLLTGDYLGITDPNALVRLLDLEGDAELRVFETQQGQPQAVSVSQSFHPKAYIFHLGGVGRRSSEARTSAKRR